MKRLLLPLIFLFCACTPKADFCFAVIADSHINGPGERADDLMAIVKDINSRDSVDFIIIAGDVTEFGTDKEIVLARQILDSLKKPYCVLAGNHDAKWSESGCNTFTRVFGYDHFFFEHEGILFMGCNSGPNMRMAPALVPRESMVWMSSLMDQIPPKMPLVFINHYPLTADMDNYTDVIDCLKRRNIILALCGHYHVNDNITAEGIPVVKCRSVVPNKTHPKVGYNLVRVQNNQWTFSETVIGGESTVWNNIYLDYTVNRDSTKYERPDYSVNTQYPNVKELWTIQDSSDIGAAAIAVEESSAVLFTNTSGKINALDLNTGALRWTSHSKGKVFSTPYVSDGKVFYSSTDKVVYGLDLETGKTLWENHCPKSFVASPVVLDSLVYAGSSNNCLYAFGVTKGQSVWEFRDVEGFIECRPYVDKEQIVFGAWDNTLYSLDPKTGKLQWKWSNEKKGRMYSPAAVWPVKSNGKIFFVTPERKTYALNASTGKELWSSAGGRESIGLSPDGSRVYVKTMFDSLFAYDAVSNKEKALWKVRGGFGYEIAPSSITATDDLVFVPTDKGFVYAYSSADGSMQWAHRLSVALINYVQPLSGRRLLVSSMDGKVSLWEY